MIRGGSAQSIGTWRIGLDRENDGVRAKLEPAPTKLEPPPVSSFSAVSQAALRLAPIGTATRIVRGGCPALVGYSLIWYN